MFTTVLKDVSMANNYLPETGFVREAQIVGQRGVTEEEAERNKQALAAAVSVGTGALSNSSFCAGGAADVCTGCCCNVAGPSTVTCPGTTFCTRPPL